MSVMLGPLCSSERKTPCFVMSREQRHHTAPGSHYSAGVPTTSFDVLQVRQELGCRHVICVCSSYDGAKVAAAARRLLANARAITAMVDLTGVLLDMK